MILWRIGFAVAAVQPLVGYHSGTAVIEQYHKFQTADTESDLIFARRVLSGRPDAEGYIQSTLFPIRCHYESEVFRVMAEEVLAIVEDSWQQQVLEMGFAAPPPDCGHDGSDDLDVYIQTLPAGVGGYAAFTCYIDSTPEADAASFMAISDALTEQFLRSAVTHEFNHVLQNAMDYWEHITFKEMTATWAMDWMYDGDNQYFGYLRSYQKNPDWPMHKFSTSNTYQYGAAIFLHFLSEYYSGGSASIIVDIWKACAQNENHNEPDFLDVLQTKSPVISVGMDSFGDLLTEYAAWRAITGSRDDGVHFHDGGLWPAGAEIDPDVTVDLSAEMPPPVMPIKAPYDYGFCYVAAVNPSLLDSALSIEFEGDPEVDWGVVIVHNRNGHSSHLTQRMELIGGWGIALLDQGLLARADDLMIGIVNLSASAFDPDDGTDGEQRVFTLTFKKETSDTQLLLWTDQPMTAPGMAYGLNVEFEYHGATGQVDFWLFLEIQGMLFPAFTDAYGLPMPLVIPVSTGMSLSAPVLNFELPALDEPIPVRWHAGLLRSGVLLDYMTTRNNCVSVYR